MASRKDWERIIAEQKASNLSATEWCRKNRIRENQFFYWRKALAEKAEKNFVRIGGSSQLEIVINDGIRISIPSDFDEGVLKRVVEVLRA